MFEIPTFRTLMWCMRVRRRKAGKWFTYNPPTSILCYEFDGPIPALKITLRCGTCGLNYR